MQLSPHFTLHEMIRSKTALRKGIDNEPSPAVLRKLIFLCEEGLEKVRALVGEPIRISSGYRSVALNAAVKGSPSSQHCCIGPYAAADFEVMGLSNRALAETIEKSDIQFDQLILEYPSPSNPQAGWVHMSLLTRGEPRREVLTALSRRGHTIYKKGLHT